MLISTIMMFKTVVQLYIFMKTKIHFPGSFDEQKAKKQHIFHLDIFCNNVKVFTVTFNKLNTPFSEEKYLFFQK